VLTATFRALDFEFGVRATDAVLQAAIEHVFAPCRHALEHLTTQYTLLDRGASATRIAVFENDRRLLDTADEALAVAYLVWQVNQRAIAASSATLLLHAAAAARDERAVLLPAPSGAGKSTLVAGLVAAGCSYVTDDLSALTDDGRRVRPYPKPIALAAETVELFAGSPGLASGARARFVGTDVFLQPGDLGGVAARADTVVDLVVVPSYHERATTQVVPLSRGETAVLLAEQSFNFDALGTRALPVLAALLHGCECYRLTYGDLDAAVATITDLLRERPAPPTLEPDRMPS
jgi:hypothetical protein